MNVARRITHLAAILALSMQILASLSPVLAQINGNWQVTICSGADIQTITINENGERLPDMPELRTHECAFCSANATVAITPDVSRLLSPIAYSAVYHEHRSQTLKTAYENRDHPPRAPPLFV